jgi:anti-sigma factor RsiW
MDRVMSHDEVAELLGAYALDAVDADEAEVIEAHLKECPRCAAELAQHREVASLLANTGSDASVELWDQIAARLDPPGDPPPTAVVLDAALAGALPRRVSERRRRLRWSAAGGVGAIAAAVIALLALQVGHLDNQVGQAGDPAHLAAVAAQNPDAHLVALRSTTGSAVTLARIVILPTGSAYVTNRRLPGLPSDKTYQLWAEERGRTISLGLLGNHPTTVPMTVSDVAQITAYAVTAERAGGVVAPSHAPLAMSASQSV